MADNSVKKRRGRPPKVKEETKTSPPEPKPEPKPDGHRYIMDPTQWPIREK